MKSNVDQVRAKRENRGINAFGNRRVGTQPRGPSTSEFELLRVRWARRSLIETSKRSVSPAGLLDPGLVQLVAGQRQRSLIGNNIADDYRETGFDRRKEKKNEQLFVSLADASTKMVNGGLFTGSSLRAADCSILMCPLLRMLCILHADI